MSSTSGQMAKRIYEIDAAIEALKEERIHMARVLELLFPEDALSETIESDGWEITLKRSETYAWDSSKLADIADQSSPPVPIQQKLSVRKADYDGLDPALKLRLSEALTIKPSAARIKTQPAKGK